MAKTFDQNLKALQNAKTTSEKLQAVSTMFVDTCATAKAGGIADTMVQFLVPAESENLTVFSAVASIVDAAERKSRDNVGAHKATEKAAKDVNSVSL